MTAHGQAPLLGYLILLWHICGTWWVDVEEFIHDDIIKWKHFPCYWPFVWGIHRSPVDSQHKGQWRRALMFSFICVCLNDLVNNLGAGDLRCYHAHYDVIVMTYKIFINISNSTLLGLMMHIWVRELGHHFHVFAWCLSGTKTLPWLLQPMLNSFQLDTEELKLNEIWIKLHFVHKMYLNHCLLNSNAVPICYSDSETKLILFLWYLFKILFRLCFTSNDPCWKRYLLAVALAEIGK